MRKLILFRKSFLRQLEIGKKLISRKMLLVLLPILLTNIALSQDDDIW